MKKTLLKQSLLTFLAFATGSANAATFLVGHKGEMDANYFKSNIEVKSLLKNLEIAIVEAENESDLDYLKLDPNILFVEESIEYEAPKKFISKPVFQMNKKKSKIETVKPVGISVVKADEVWSKYKTKGKNIRVLVLDTGIDINHPALSSSVEKAKNFIKADGNNFADTNGHGTHVAGTIAANGPLLGVAPEVTILAGRVCNNGCPSEAVLEGVEWGIAEKVDVMNLSLGGPMSSSSARVAYAKAQAKNIVVIAASGNDGQLTNSFPASYSEVLSVGAVDKNLLIADFSNWSSTLDVVAPGVDVYSAVPQGTGRMGKSKITSTDGAEILEVSPMTGTGVATLRNKEVVFAGLGTVGELSKVDVKGKIALIKRGEITFKEKLDNAVAAGSAGVIVFNNVKEPFSGTLGDDVVNDHVIVLIDLDKGEALLKKLAMGKVTADLSVEATDYQNNQGTSMASPHVAGIAALIRAKNPNLNAVQVKNLIKETAIETTNANPEKYGRGVVDALSAVKKATSL